MENLKTAENAETCNFLSLLTAVELKMVEQNSTLVELEKNEYVFQEAQPSENIYFVKRGRIKIVTNTEEEKEVLKSLVHEGEILGGGAAFGEHTRMDTAMAMDDIVELWVMPANVARDLMKNNSEFSFKVMSQISLKLRMAEKRLESLTFKNSRTRIIEFLKDTARRQGRKIGYETLLHPFLTHQDIGNLTTTSRQTVSSVLNELKGSNKIYYDRHRLLIRDLTVL